MKLLNIIYKYIYFMANIRNILAPDVNDSTSELWFYNSYTSTDRGSCKLSFNHNSTAGSRYIKFLLHILFPKTIT